MKKMLTDWCPELLDSDSLPVPVTVAQAVTEVINGDEVFASASELRFVNVPDFQSSQVFQRGGHYKPISKMIAGKAKNTNDLQ